MIPLSENTAYKQKVNEKLQRKDCYMKFRTKDFVQLILMLNQLAYCPTLKPNPFVQQFRNLE